MDHIHNGNLEVEGEEDQEDEGEDLGGHDEDARSVVEEENSIVH